MAALVGDGGNGWLVAVGCAVKVAATKVAIRSAIAAWVAARSGVGGGCAVKVAAIAVAKDCASAVWVAARSGVGIGVAVAGGAVAVAVGAGVSEGMGVEAAVGWRAGVADEESAVSIKCMAKVAVTSTVSTGAWATLVGRMGSGCAGGAQ